MVEGQRFEVGEAVHIKAPLPSRASRRRAAAVSVSSTKEHRQFARIVAMWQERSGATFLKWRVLTQYVASEARSAQAFVVPACRMRTRAHRSPSLLCPLYLSGRSEREESELIEADDVQEGPSSVLKGKFVLITRAEYEQHDFSGDKDIMFLAKDK